MPSTVYRGDLSEITFGPEAGVRLEHGYAGTFVFKTSETTAQRDAEKDTSVITFTGGAINTPVSNGVLAFPNGMLVGSKVVFSIKSNGTAWKYADDYSEGGRVYTIVKQQVATSGDNDGETEITVTPMLNTAVNQSSQANDMMTILPFGTPAMDVSMSYHDTANLSAERVLTDQFVGLVSTVALPETKVDLKRYHVVGLGRDVAVQVPGKFLNTGGTFECNIHNGRWFRYCLGQEVVKPHDTTKNAAVGTYILSTAASVGDSYIEIADDGGTDNPAIGGVAVGVGDYVILDTATEMVDVQTYRETAVGGGAVGNAWPAVGASGIFDKAIKEQVRRVVAMTATAGDCKIWLDQPLDYGHPISGSTVTFARYASNNANGSPNRETDGNLQYPIEHLFFSRTTVPSFSMEVSVRRNDNDGGDVTVTDSGTAINNGSGYAVGTTSAMTTDGTAASSSFAVGDNVYLGDGTLLGTVTANGSTSLTLAGGTSAALVDDAKLYKISGVEVTDGGASDSKQLTRVFRGCKVKEWSLTADTDAALRLTTQFDSAYCYTDTGRLESTKGDRYDAHRLFEDTANTEIKRKESGIEKGTQKPFMFYNGTIRVLGTNLGQVLSFTLNGKTGVQQYWTINGTNIADAATDQVPFAGSRNPSLAVEGKTEYDMELEIIVDDPLFYHNMRRAVTNFDDDTGDNVHTDQIRLSFVKQGTGATRESIEILMDDYYITEAPLPIPEDKGPMKAKLKVMPKSIKVISKDTVLSS